MPKDDSLLNLNKLCEVLINVYDLGDETIEGKTMVSGYNNFPDLCTAMNFALEAYATQEAALLGYYNLPNQRQINKLLTIAGKWIGEWQENKSMNNSGELFFYMDGEYLKADLTYEREKNKIVTEPMDIKLFGNYFKIKGFNENDMIHDKNIHVHFELEIFNDNILIGKNMKNQKYVIFKKEI